MRTTFQGLPSEEELIAKWSQNNEVIVSIVCICFNHEKYIGQALNSFLTQDTVYKYEIIVHDDASTDNSRDIIEQYKMMYPNVIKTIYQDVNVFTKEPYNIFMIPFNECQGRLIAICEADDFWISTNKIQRQCEYMLNNNNVQLTFHSAKIIDENGHEIKVNDREFYHEQKFSVDEVINSWFINTQTIMFRNNVDNIDFASMKEVLNLDWALQLLCATKGYVVFVSDIYAGYRKHSEGVSVKLLSDAKYRTLKQFALLDWFNKYTDFKYASGVNKRKLEVLNEFSELFFRRKYGSIIYFLLNPKTFIRKLVNVVKR